MVGSSIAFAPHQHQFGSVYGQRNQPVASSSSQALADDDTLDDRQRDGGSSPSRDPITILEKKRKNASAQAAFRARRSTYIANLEETVISLETVIRKLQDACRDAHDDVGEFRDENIRLKALVSGFEEREKIWKAYAKATAGTPAALAATSSLSAAVHASLHSQSQSQGSSSSSSQQPLPGTPPSSRGSIQDSAVSSACYSEEATVYGDEVNYTFGKMEECDGGDSLRLYTTTTTTTAQDSMTVAPQFTFPSSSTTNLNSVPPTPSSATMHCGDYNDLTSMALVSENAGYYVDSNISEHDSMYPATMTYSPNDMYFSAPQHRRTFSTPQAQADSGSSGCGVNQNVVHFSNDLDGAPLNSGGSSEGSRESSSSVARSRRHTYSSLSSAPTTSQLPAPSTPRRARTGPTTTGTGTRTSTSGDATTMSNTLAVIKAQAFGNVRKTRARVKRPSASAGAAKAAVEILEARGLSLGLDIAGGVKRRRRGDSIGGD